MKWWMILRTVADARNEAEKLRHDVIGMLPGRLQSVGNPPVCRPQLEYQGWVSTKA